MRNFSDQLSLIQKGTYNPVEQWFEKCTLYLQLNFDSI